MTDVLHYQLVYIHIPAETACGLPLGPGVPRTHLFGMVTCEKCVEAVFGLPSRGLLHDEGVSLTYLNRTPHGG